MSRFTVKDFKANKGGRIVMVTAYDYPSARLAEAAGVDAILVGDSVGTVVLGYGETQPVTLAEMVHHAKAARRGARDTFLVADVPYLADATFERALASAERLLKEARADAVKIEGPKPELVERLVAAGVPVMGHLGLTPQTASQLGGYKVQGRDLKTAKKLLADARALEAAGAFALVLEMVPAPLAALITEELNIPTIGIGSGPGTDGQVLVFHDLLGLFEDFKPRFVKRYLEGAELFRAALKAYAEDVKSGRFPEEKHSFTLKDEVLSALKKGL